MKFTIRDLCWLTVVVALAVGWWLHANKLKTDYIKALERALLRRPENDFLDKEIQRYMEEIERKAEARRAAD